MKETKRRLGRGLDSLLSSTRIKEIDHVAGQKIKEPLPDSSVAISPANVTPVQSPHGDDMVVHIPVDQVLVNPHQPRRHWDEERLQHLAESIRANGLIQPVIVRQMGEGYQLIAGERRLRATKIAGKTTILAVIRQASEQQVVEWALVENIHRDDLDPIERAHAYRHYIDHFLLTQEQAALKLGEDRTTIANYMRLLDLPEEVRSLLSGGKISMGHARALLGIRDAKIMTELAQSIPDKHLTVRDIEKIVRNLNAQTHFADRPAEPRKPHIVDLEREMSQKLGTKVLIKPQGHKGHRGKIIIEFYNLDDFDRIRDMLQ